MITNPKQDMDGALVGPAGGSDNMKFMCGVVEGFYGRPWTSEQRKILFQRMNTMGLNTYLYAPKDDSKHRVYWRDLYTVEEAEHLRALISCANEHNVTFVYALSPGLDMTYSNAKEITCLKRKLEQVASFGCKAFALLFDDIEVDMCESDKQIFQSFAQAQVSVTNEVFQHLGQPGNFLFCPTEYCASRSVPDVIKSEYLNTIGSRLLSGIDVMWTGPKVISKRISIKSIEELTQVLRRPPVIWDNIHANDYDQRRLFLGPYDGRSSELIPYLRGVMTNPNCEFEANFIAMHTLAQWSKSNVGGTKKDFILSESPVSADIRLETEGDFTTDDDIPVNSILYQPKVALFDAIKDWKHVFNLERCPGVTKTVIVPPPLSLPATITPCVDVATNVNNLNVNTNLQNTINNINESFMQPTTVQTMNSFSGPPPISDSTSEPALIPEPMDCGSLSSGASTCSSVPEVSGAPDDSISLSDAQFVKPTEPVETMQIDTEISKANESTQDLLSEKDIQDIVELFYVPFDHGTNGLYLLNEFNWLKISAKDLCEQHGFKDHSPAAEEWQNRANAFCQRLQHLCNIFRKFCSIPNKALMYDLFPYLWDMAVVLNQLHTFTEWLALGHVSVSCAAILQGSPYSWSNVMFRDHFSSGDQEPWVFRGGLQAEFQRLLPLEGSADLLLMACPPVPSINLSNIRPYRCTDEAAVYEICRKTCDDGLDGTDIFPDMPDLIGDKLVGAFVTISPEYSFVIEDDRGVYGYVLAAINAKLFKSKADIAWSPAMLEKYPKPTKEDNLSPADEIIASFHNKVVDASLNLHTTHPAVLRIDILPDRILEATVAKRAMASVCAALKVGGAHGVHTEIHVGDQSTVNFYTKLGFLEIPLPDTPENLMYMGRMI